VFVLKTKYIGNTAATQEVDFQNAVYFYMPLILLKIIRFFGSHCIHACNYFRLTLTSRTSCLYFFCSSFLLV